MRTNQFDLALEGLVKDNKETSIALKDGTSLTGRIREFDGYVLVLDGDPMRMVYRHSILKLSEAVERKTERPAPRPADRQSQRPAEAPRTGKPPRPRTDRPQRERRPEPDRRPQPKTAQEEHVSMGTMGDAMQKWLKSQKGGE